MSGEDKLWDYVRINLTRQWHATRVENHLAGPGIPDVDYCIAGYPSHLELKHSASKVTPEIRDTQIRWHMNRHKHGGWSYILTHFELMDRSDVYMLHMGHCIKDMASTPNFQAWQNMAFYKWLDTIDFKEFRMAIGGML